MAKMRLDSFKNFYDALINLKYRETLTARLNVDVRCLGPKLPYINNINESFYNADQMIIRFDTKMVLVDNPPDAEKVKVKVFDRYYFHLFKKEDMKIPFSMIKFNYIHPWEYKEENIAGYGGYIDRYITTETVSDKIPVRIDLREYMRKN